MCNACAMDLFCTCSGVHFYKSQPAICSACCPLVGRVGWVGWLAGGPASPRLVDWGVGWLVGDGRKEWKEWKGLGEERTGAVQAGSAFSGVGLRGLLSLQRWWRVCVVSVFWHLYSRVRKVLARISRPRSRHKTSIFSAASMDREVELVYIGERIKRKAITVFGRCLSSTWYTIFEESPHNHKSTPMWELISCPGELKGNAP